MEKERETESGRGRINRSSFSEEESHSLSLHPPLLSVVFGLLQVRADKTKCFFVGYLWVLGWWLAAILVIMKKKIEEESGERRVWGFHGKVSAAAIVFSLDEAKSAFGFVYVNIYHLLDDSFFLTYLLKSFADYINPHEESICKSIFNLLVTYSDSVSIRKELLVALKHVLGTYFKRGLFPLIDTLVEERQCFVLSNNIISLPCSLNFVIYSLVDTSANN
ncbi:phosphotransferases/inositol or phosphatidylinositol kinase [Actinidia rufa]|uniref:Phosphotransferases/inositol or phosphatidylinositol kinase n=1 Tax=Actinidia rufa TaxID=165716 RepID=A0A7J0D972_9ERIC|nr:phosphotransferases/inositol or phosphatidylinositol kinase [Actinidia rufa]